MPKKPAVKPTRPAPKPLNPNVVVSCGQHLDHSMSSMDEIRFKKKHFDLTRRLAQELHFTFTEMECIFLMYEKFRLANGKHAAGMTVEQMNDFIHNGLDMTDVEITQYAVSNFHVSYDHKKPRNIFQMEAWARAMSLLIKGTFEEKVQHCFKVYDTMNVGIISKETMQGLMEKNLVGEENPEEATRDLLEILVKKLDVDRDGKVNFTDFEECVKAEPLLLEVFGECLPSRYAAQSFLTTFTTNVGRL